MKATSATPTDGDENDLIAEKLSGPSSAKRDVVCPVCRAAQAPAEICRRCRADLSLVMGLRERLDVKRSECLALVRQRRLLRATRLADECLQLSDDAANRRLLSTCYLMQGDFAAALRILAR